MSIVGRAKRLKTLPPYLFREIDRKKAEVIAKGVDIIDLGVGDPDLPTPDLIIEAMKKATGDPLNHRYPSYSGMNKFRNAAAEWFMDRFGVALDPEKEVLSLIGSKEGIAHLPLAFIDPGDVALVPSPAYPVYNIATMFAGGESYFMPLTSDNNFLPDLDSIPPEIIDRAKLLFINYPNNPTAAVADIDFFNKVVEFAKKNELLVCHDAAYTEMAFDGYSPPSFLQADGAKEVGIELHSLSKTFNMTGWRIGFAVGNREAVEGLGAIKSNIDSGVFQAIQIAAIEGLRNYRSLVGNNMKIYSSRRDQMIDGLKESGLEVKSPKATFYLWVRIPDGYTSAQLAARLLETGVVVTPGNGFGDPGEGYVRMALTQKDDRLTEAIERIKGLGL
ncbi:LL-diaminopimelate aminotransferase [Deltaproteobacteria bacterium]|nr:LL-diaminopimelate aminotransferase [Deltaproteobacteria bacterium]